MFSRVSGPPEFSHMPNTMSQCRDYVSRTENVILGQIHAKKKIDLETYDAL